METADARLTAIERLAALRSAGVLSDEEFADAKARALTDPVESVARIDAQPLEASAEPVSEESWYFDTEPRSILPKPLVAIFVVLLLGGIGGSGYLAFASSIGSGAESAYAAEEDAASDDVDYETETTPVASADIATDVVEEAAADSSRLTESYTGSLSCRYAGQGVPVSYCLQGTGASDVSGELKVTREGAVKQYSAIELAQLSDYNKAFDLGSNFEFSTQAGSDENAVLRLEISSTSGPVYEDEASGFGVINVSSWQLENQ